MEHSLRGKIAIVGVGTTARWNNPGYSSLDQLASAVQAATLDAGLRISDIDGLFAATQTQTMPTSSVAEYLGISPCFMEGTYTGGSSSVCHVLTAMLALQAGLCSVACICYGSNQLSASGRLATFSEIQPWEAPYHPRNPISAYALAAARHMYQFGTTREQLAQVAVAARQWALLNDDAYESEPLTVEDVLNSRLISDPLSRRDCCLVTDGGGAIILVRADHARHLSKNPIYVLGAGMATTHRQISCMPDLTTTCATESGTRAYEMAGVMPREVDILQIYDAFTITPILFLEDLGFCPKGEGGRFVENGAIAPGGALAVNTNGGGLSCNHPGMYGIYTLIEATRQLRGEAGRRQQPGAQIALAHGNGGLFSSQATAILGTSEVL